MSSPVVNLHSIDSSLLLEPAIDSIITHWRATKQSPINGDPCATENFRVNDHRSPSIENVDPYDEITFPGISSLDTELRSWNWIFGRTPKFAVEKRFLVDDSVTRDSAIEINLVIFLDKAKIVRVEVAPVVGEEIDSAAGHELNLFVKDLETKLNDSLSEVEFRSQVVSLHLAQMANQLASESFNSNLPGNTSASSTSLREIIALSLFDHLADLCLQ